MYFIDLQHYERFNDLILSNKSIKNNKIRHFQACFYIFAKSQKLFNLSKKFISSKNINFMDFWLEDSISVVEKLFITLANNLFSNTRQINLLELIVLDDIDYKIAINAVNIRRNLNYGNMEYNYTGRPRKASFETIQLMKKEKLTQEQIAKLLNVSLSTIKRNWK